MHAKTMFHIHIIPSSHDAFCELWVWLPVSYWTWVFVFSRSVYTEPDITAAISLKPSRNRFMNRFKVNTEPFCPPDPESQLNTGVINQIRWCTAAAHRLRLTWNELTVISCVYLLTTSPDCRVPAAPAWRRKAPPREEPPASDWPPSGRQWRPDPDLKHIPQIITNIYCGHQNLHGLVLFFLCDFIPSYFCCFVSLNDDLAVGRAAVQKIKGERVWVWKLFHIHLKDQQFKHLTPQICYLLYVNEDIMAIICK